MKELFGRKAAQPPQRKKTKAQKKRRIFATNANTSLSSITSLSKPHTFFFFYPPKFSSFEGTATSNKKPPPAMGKHPVGCVLIFSLIASLGLVSFASCLVAEAKRTKKGDLKLDGKLCLLPKSHAFGFGVAALICLSIAQIIGNVVVCANYWSRSGKARKAKKPILTALLLAISWVSFGVAVILISAATSMSRTQPYGEGWLDGECYIVRGGVYISSGVLSLVAVLALLGAAAIMITTNQVDQCQKVYAAQS